MLIGVISDTHGLLRPEALAALQGAQHIIHAGDICAPEVLVALAQIAPVTAVRGNNDKGAWASRLPATAVFEAEGVSIYVLHDLAELDLDPAAAGFGIVIAGHSHTAVAGRAERRPFLQSRERRTAAFSPSDLRRAPALWNGAPSAGNW